MLKIHRSIIVIVLAVFLFFIQLAPTPVAALQFEAFADWFPLPLEMGSLLALGVTIILVMAGTVCGIVIKELQITRPEGNPIKINLMTYEHKLFLILGGSLSIGFWISGIPAFDCFLASTALKAGLGTMRNVMEKKKNGK